MSVVAEAHARYEKSKKTVVLDKNVFQVCEIKLREIGLISKKLLFIHFDGQTWNILYTNSDMSHFKNIQIT